MKRSVSVVIDLTSDHESTDSPSLMEYPNSPDAQCYSDFLTELERADANLASQSTFTTDSDDDVEESDSFIENPPTPSEDPTFDISVREESESSEEADDEPEVLRNLRAWEEIYIEPAALRDLRAWRDHAHRYFRYGDSLCQQLDKLLHIERIAERDELMELGVKVDNTGYMYFPNV